jgi:hypothetical protein
MTSEWILYKKYNNVYKMNKIPKIEYIITNEMVKKIKQDIQNKKEKKIVRDTYFRFYKMYKDNKIIIAYTNLKLNDMIYNMIKYNLSGKQTYISIYETYIDVKIRLLDIYKGEINKKIINEIKKEYETTENIQEIIKPNKEIIRTDKLKNQLNKNIFKEYRNIINKYYQNNELKKYYLFLVKETICGGFKKGINKEQLENKLGFKFDKKDIKIIGDVNVKSELEGLIYIDKYIYENNINQPYYIYKKNKDPNKYIYSLIQLEKIKNVLINIKYKDIEEYIYRIQINDYYFFDKSLGKYTLINNLENIYMTEINNDKYNKIRQKILTTSFDKIKIDILKIKYRNSDINLDILLERYNEKYCKNNKINKYRFLYTKKNN